MGIPHLTNDRVVLNRPLSKRVQETAEEVPPEEKPKRRTKKIIPSVEASADEIEDAK